MRNREVVKMAGQVWGLAASSPTGPVFVTSYESKNPRTTVLSALDLGGGVIWRRRFEGHPGPPRVDVNGAVWLSHRGPLGYTLTAVDPDGNVINSVTPVQEPHEHLGAFVLLPDGVCVAWLPATRNRLVEPGRTSRLARYRSSGEIVWSTSLPLQELAFAGVVEMGVDTDWHVRPMRPWKPDNIDLDHREPLLVAGDRVLVGIQDGSSGIGVVTILDLSTGQVVASTPPGPHDHKAIVGPDEFLVGSQGYGALSSTLYDRDGRQLQQWASHGMMLVDRYGRIRGPESENVLPSRSRFRVLNPDGTIHDGPPLSGYYMSYPALDADGTVVFFRDGSLIAVDAALRARQLFTRDDSPPVISRILLLDNGRLMFALHDELIIFCGHGLGKLDRSSWPCGEGNLQGNPVAFI